MMFFTICGRVVAVLAVLFGTLEVAFGFWIAGMEDPLREQVLARYFPSSGSSGQVIDRGLYHFLFGVVLGILTEISYTLKRANTLSREHDLSVKPRSPV